MSILRDLETTILPITKKFKIFYAALSENHPTKGKPAWTTRIPVKF